MKCGTLFVYQQSNVQNGERQSTKKIYFDTLLPADK